MAARAEWVSEGQANRLDQYSGTTFPGRLQDRGPTMSTWYPSPSHNRELHNLFSYSD